MSKHHSRIAFFLILCILLLAADLFSKSWSFANVADQPVIVNRQTTANTVNLIPPHKEITIIPHILALKLVLNKGAVFGIGQGNVPTFLIITIIAISLITYIFLTSKSNQWLFHITLTLILAGALGNLYDRALCSAVRDMCWLFPNVNLPLNLHWPNFIGGSNQLYPWVFNLADTYLCIGISLIIIRSFIQHKSQKSSATP